MKVVCAFLGAVFVLASSACKQVPHVDLTASHRQTTNAKQTSGDKMKELTLSHSQSEAALKSATMAVASARIGYPTTDPSVVVAELWQGSGVAYASWVVLRSSDGKSWHVIGKPSEVVVADPRKKVRVTEMEGDNIFEVELPSSGKTIRLDLPN